MSEHGCHASDSRYQRVDFLFRVVKGERGAHGAADTQPLHQGLGAVMASAHGDAKAVEQGADVQMVDAFPAG